LQATRPDAEFVQVSHADVLRAPIAASSGVPIDLMTRSELAPASRSVILLSAGGIRVDALNPNA